MVKTSGFDQLSQVAGYCLQQKLLKYCISIIYIDKYCSYVDDKIYISLL